MKRDVTEQELKAWRYAYECHRCGVGADEIGERLLKQQGIHADIPTVLKWAAKTPPGAEKSPPASAAPKKRRGRPPKAKLGRPRKIDVLHVKGRVLEGDGRYVTIPSTLPKLGEEDGRPADAPPGWIPKKEMATCLKCVNIKECATIVQRETQESFYFRCPIGRV